MSAPRADSTPQPTPTAGEAPRQELHYAQVVVAVAPDHLDRPFDYAVPDGVSVEVGQQVAVTFAGRRRTGWVLGVSDSTEADPAKVRRLTAVQGEHRWFDDDDLRLFRWVADRYAASLADVLRHALPERVVRVEREEPPPVTATAAARPPCPTKAWRPYHAARLLRAAFEPRGEAFHLRPLRDDDPGALAADLTCRALAGGRSVLVLAPGPDSPVAAASLEIAGDAGADLRGVGKAGLYRAFLRGRSGHLRVVTGERGAAFAPLRELGLVIVDDEANPAYKERRSPRFHAREVALARARLAGATCVLLGDLPSARVWRLLTEGHVKAVRPDRATERQRAPRVEVVALGDGPARPSGGPGPGAPRPSAADDGPVLAASRGRVRARLAPRAYRALADAVGHNRAAVVLAARSGEGALLVCSGCRERRRCPVCDGAVRPVRGTADGAVPGWECPQCGWHGAAFACRSCGSDRAAPAAAGVLRLAAELARSFPQAEVGAMEGFDAPGPARRPALAVMTRGSVVARPAWLRGERAAAVVVVDADALLSRAAFDAAEDALRLWLAVARWADALVVQTRQPTHAAVQALVRWDADGFWEREAPRRAELRYPPTGALVRLTLTGRGSQVREATGALRAALPTRDEVLGPDLDGGLLVKTGRLRGTLDALAPLRRTWSKAGPAVRIDVDPLA